MQPSPEPIGEQQPQGLDRANAPQVEWSQASLELMQQIRGDFRSYDAYFRIKDLVRTERAAALAFLPEYLSSVELTQELQERLTGYGMFTKQELQSTAVDAFGALIENSGHVLKTNYSSHHAEDIMHRLHCLIVYADLKTSESSMQITEQLKPLLVDTYIYENRSAEFSVYRMLKNLGTEIPWQELKDEFARQIESSFTAVIADGNQSREHQRIIIALSEFVDVTPELKALAQKAYPAFTLNEESGAKYIERFSIPREDVIAEAGKQADLILAKVLSGEYSITGIHYLHKYLTGLQISADQFDDKLISVLDQALQVEKMDVVLSIFEDFQLDVSCLESEPRRTIAQKAFESEIVKAYSAEEAESGGRVYRFEEILASRDPKPVAEAEAAAEAVDDDDFFCPTYVESEPTYGYFSRWYNLGQIPVLYEVLEGELREALQDRSEREIHFRKFEERIILPVDFMPGAETQKAVQTWAIDQLSRGFDYRAEAIARFGSDIREVELQEAALAGLVKTIKEPNPFRSFKRSDVVGLAKEYIENLQMASDSLDHPQVRAAFLARTISELEAGKLDVAMSIRKYFSMDSEWNSPEVKDATVRGFVHILSSHSPERAFEFAKAAEIPIKDVTSALETVLLADPKPVLAVLEVMPERIRGRLESRYHLDSYARDLCIPSVEVYTRYREHADARDSVGLAAYVKQIENQLEALISTEPQSAEFLQQTHYKELIEIVFPNNSGGWTDFDRNEMCEDRSADLAQLKIRDNYSFTVSPGSDMQVKPGKTRDEAGIEALNAHIQKAQALFEGVNFDRDRMLTLFDSHLEVHTRHLRPSEAFQTREEKLFGLLLEQIAHRGDIEKTKELIIAYQYAQFQGIREYIEGTRGRAEQSRNPEYAYLLELREFFADRLKDVERQISDSALKNPALRDQLPIYFEEYSVFENKRLATVALQEMQIERLGLSEGFIRQIGKTLKQKTGMDQTRESILEVIRDYEERSAGLADADPPESSFDPALYGQIRAQREKTIRALEKLSGSQVSRSETFLGDVNLGEYLNKQKALTEGRYDSAVFSAFLAHSFATLFKSEIQVLDTEIAKYASVDSESAHARPKRVEAYITKNHTSAHARAVAGVCVSGDNPVESGEPVENLWQRPNYFQMVLRDAETKLCKGCVLLHIEEENGKRYLTASMNPSSTYLYQVNESEMFRSIRHALIEFARENDIDAIGVSTTGHIRTNRTGGLFERAMDECIRAVKERVTFSTSRTFSFKPAYEQTEIDLIWINQRNG